MVTRQAIAHWRSIILGACFFLGIFWLSACQPTPTNPLSELDIASETPEGTATTSPATEVTDQHESSTLAPSATPDCLQSGGTLTSDRFYSERLTADIDVHVYLPPCYDPNGSHQYPTLYLLHGLSYDHDQWLRLGLVETLDNLIANQAIPPFIVVLPREAVFAPPQTSPYGDAITEDLIPWVTTHYKTRDEKAYRAMGGVSRGAAWAVKLGFENYSFFDRVGAHSLALFESDGGRLTAWTTQTPRVDLPMFFIDIGRGDREWQTAQTFADLLDQNNIPHVWYLFSGEHTESYWAQHLPLYLQWYSEGWE